MILQSERIKKSDYLIATLFLACGGNQLFTENKWYAFIVVGIMLVMMLFQNRRLWSKELLLVEIAFFTIALLQIAFLPLVSMPAYMNFAMKLFAGFLMVSYLGTKFRFAYFRVIVFFAVISLFFWTFDLFFNIQFGVPVGKACRSIGVWAYFMDEEVPRNQGMFWEPGAYQGYLMLVPIMFIGELKELWRKEKISCIILIAALLSTTSTTGYVALMFIVGMYLIKGIKNTFSRVLMIIVLAATAYYATISLDFLGNKIQEQYLMAIDMSYESAGTMQSRMGTMFIDFEIIKNHPVIGNGFDMDAKYGIYSDIMISSGNGLTGLICTLGIPFFLLYLIGVYKRSPAQKFFKLIAIATILLVFYGENFYNFIPYWALLFVLYDVNDIALYGKKI